MDSGVETGNESNDSSVVAHSKFFSHSLSKSPWDEELEELPREPQPPQKLELFFNNVVPNNIEIITDNRIKTNLSFECPHPSQHTQSYGLFKMSDREKACNSLSQSLLKDPPNFQVFFTQTNFPKMVMNLVSLTKGRELILNPATMHDHCSKIKNRVSLVRRPSSTYLPLQPRKDALLHSAIVTNNTELLERLLNEGKASPNVADGLGRTPLHMAASRGYTEVVRILLAHGADPNLKDRIGNTPLHLAAVTSKTAIVDLLLKAGTNVMSIDQFGNNPLDLAKTKLRVLQSCKSSNIDNIKEEVENVISILKLYLQKSNAATEQVEALSEICSRLSLSNSTDQIQDDVKNLLSNLDSLSLT